MDIIYVLAERTSSRDLWLTDWLFAQPVFKNLNRFVNKKKKYSTDLIHSFILASRLVKRKKIAKIYRS